MVQKTIINTLKKAAIRMNNSRKINHLILFGSHAKGTANKDSDVDLIVVSPSFEKIPFFKRANGLRSDIGLNVPMDIICLTPKEFYKKKSQISIVSEAVKTGVDLISVR